MENNGYAQLKAIIEEILEAQQKKCGGHGFPKWDFLNGVLSCEDILGKYELWFHFGELRIVPSKKKYDGLKAGDLEVLEEWNTEANGTITLIGKKK